jgi:hypothetical protein
MKVTNETRDRPAGMAPAVATIIDAALGAAAAAGIDVAQPSAELSAYVAQHLAAEVVRLRRAASAGYARLPPSRPTMAPKPKPPAAI